MEITANDLFIELPSLLSSSTIVGSYGYLTVRIKPSVLLTTTPLMFYSSLSVAIHGQSWDSIVHSL